MYAIRSYYGNDAAVLDKINLFLENGWCVAVETDDKSTLNLQSGPLQVLYVFNKITVPVLLLARFGVPQLAGRFNSDEDHVKSGRDHHLYQRRIISQVD